MEGRAAYVRHSSIAVTPTAQPPPALSALLGVTPGEASERRARGQAPFGLGGRGGLVGVFAAVSGDCFAIGSHGTMSQATLIGKLSPPTWLLQSGVLGHRERLHQIGDRQPRQLDLEFLMSLELSNTQIEDHRNAPHDSEFSFSYSLTLPQ